MKLAIDKSTLEGIGDAIRMKKGTSDLIAVPNLAEEILTIPSGGGELPDWIVMGEVTPQTNLTEYTVAHNKGKAPTVAIMYAEDMGSNRAYLQKISVGALQGGTHMSGATAYNSYQGAYGGFSANVFGVKAMNESIVTFQPRGSNYVFLMGFTYKYFLFFEEE